ncbi:hypothetical protein LCGC14_2440700 [marine sediment metagenome]|uniref:Uncharacterized protein n=1 Tax=marine sediment metagenome TaxID=412755 RepID=A0A0F9C6I4_9ZZZZ
MTLSRYKCLVCGSESRFKALADAHIEAIVDGFGTILKVDLDQVIESQELKITEVTDCLACGASGPESIIDKSAEGYKKEPGGNNDQEGERGEG